MQLTLLILAALASLCVGSEHQKPGLIVVHTEKSLKKWYEEVVFGEMLDEKLNQSTIPAIHRNLTTIFGSELYLDLIDIKLTHFERPEVDVIVTSAKGIVLNVRVSTMSIVGNHATRLDNGFSDENKWRGNFTLLIEDMTLQISKDIVLVETEKMKWESTNMTGLIKNIKINTNDPELDNQLAMVNSKDIEKLVLEVFSLAYKNLTEYEIDFSYNITEDIHFDMSFVGKIKIRDGVVEFPHRAEALYKGDSRRLVGEEPLEMEFVHPNSTMEYKLNEFPFKTAAYIAHNHKLLSSNFTKANLPDNHKKLLDTTCDNGCFGELFPKAKENFPDSSVELIIETVSPPVVNITQESFQVKMEFELNVTANKDKETPKDVFTVRLLLTTAVHSSVIDKKVHFGLESVNTEVVIIDSKIGDLSHDNVLIVSNLVLEDVFGPILKKTKIEGLDLRLPEQFEVKYYEWELKRRLATLMLDFKEPEDN